MTVHLERIYEHAQPAGYRVLVDGLWPRGISRQRAALDEWCKELAPDAALRTWFGHRPERWGEFQKRYREELQARKDAAQALLRRADGKKLVLLYGAKDKAHTHAIVLKHFLETL